MLVLVVSVCLISQTQVCRDVHLTYASQTLTPMQCMMSGQAQIAQWVNEHPQWAVRRWKCSSADRIASDI